MSYNISGLGLVSEFKMILNYVTRKKFVSEGVALNVEETKCSHQLFLALNNICLLKWKLFSGYCIKELK